MEQRIRPSVKSQRFCQLTIRSMHVYLTWWWWPGNRYGLGGWLAIICIFWQSHDLKAIFDITDLREPMMIVRIEITHWKDSVTIFQGQYVNSILKRHGMENTNPVSTPMDPNVKLEPNEEEREPNHSNSYASLIGSLQYLTVATCPDIAYAVNWLAAYTANLSFDHHNAAKRVLRYLKGTRSYRITYRDQNTRLVGPSDSNLFYGFSDAAFANADDRKSISSYVFLSNMGAITWMSKKQTTIALSTTEAEYVALSEARVRQHGSAISMGSWASYNENQFCC